MVFSSLFVVTARAETAAGVNTTVLAFDDGSLMVAAMTDRLEKEGVQVEILNLNDGARPSITREFLVSDDPNGNVGNYFGVVLPTDAPAQLSTEERQALADYEAEFNVRQVSMYDWANPTLGLNYAADPGYMGAVDGMSAQITAEGLQGPFAYLDGSLQLDDFDTAVSESYGYLAVPLADDPNGGTFTPLVTANIPGTDAMGSLMGVYDQGGRQRLIITFASNQYQQHFKVLGHGVVNWLTQGVSTSINRNYLSVHSDDVFMSDALWSIDGKCTIGDGCDPALFPPEAPGSTVRMENGDFDRLISWQNQYGIVIDQVFNGFGSQDYLNDNDTPVDPLLEEAQANAGAIRWINHTWQHEFMGCLQTSNTPPWSCLTDENGDVLWYPKERVDSEISLGVDFAANNGFVISPNELVTGEHSGLLTLPQQVDDNPNFVSSLTDQGITWVASDASREKEPRVVGSATTVPRYPMNLYYNVSTKPEVTAEFNWIYTSRANGGSGLCEDYPETSTCISPLDLETGFDDYIQPLEVRMMFSHIVNNDARPHFAHQSNMARDGILYPVVGDSVSQYLDIFADNTPLVNPTLSEAGEVLVAHQTWDSNKAFINGEIIGSEFRLTNNADYTIQTPVTVPASATLGGQAFGEQYSGQSSGWISLEPAETVSISLSGEAAFDDATAESQPDPDTNPEAPMPEDAPNTEVIEEPIVDSEQIEAAEDLAADENAGAPTEPASEEQPVNEPPSEENPPATTGDTPASADQPQPEQPTEPAADQPTEPSPAPEQVPPVKKQTLFEKLVSMLKDAISKRR